MPFATVRSGAVTEPDWWVSSAKLSNTLPITPTVPQEKPVGGLLDWICELKFPEAPEKSTSSDRFIRVEWEVDRRQLPYGMPGS